MKYIGTFNLKDDADDKEFKEFKQKLYSENQKCWKDLRDGKAIQFEEVRQYSFMMEATNVPYQIKVYAARDYIKETIFRKKIINTHLRKSNTDSEFLNDL